MTIRVDSDYHATEVREEGAIIGELSIPASTPADTWNRLMPSGNTGATVANAANQANIGQLRADLLPRELLGWRFKILNEDFLQENQIDGVDVNAANEVILTFVRQLYLHDSLPATGLEWVIFPLVDFKFGVGVMESAPDGQAVQLGKGADEVYAPDIKPFWRFDDSDDQQHVHIRTAQVDKIFYRFAQETTETNILVWGEYEATRV